MSFLANFSVQYDDIRVTIAQYIREEQELPVLQFERLLVATGVVLLGLTIEQLTDKQAKRLIFILMSSFCMTILVYQVIIFQNPIKHYKDGQYMVG